MVRSRYRRNKPHISENDRYGRWQTRKVNIRQPGDAFEALRNSEHRMEATEALHVPICGKCGTHLWQPRHHFPGAKAFETTSAGTEAPENMRHLRKKFDN